MNDIGPNACAFASSSKVSSLRFIVGNDKLKKLQTVLFHLTGHLSAVQLSAISNPHNFADRCFTFVVSKLGNQNCKNILSSVTRK